MNEKAQSKLEAYLEAWSSSLAAFLAQLSPGSWKPEILTATDNYESVIRFSVVLEKGLQGTQTVSLGAADGKLLLSLFMGEADTPAELFDPTQKEALEELIRQWSGLAATELKPGFGEVALRVAQETSGGAISSGTKLMRVSDGMRTVTVAIELGEDIVTALAPTAAVQIDEPSKSLAAPLSSTIERLLHEGNLDLLMDVELGVMLRFGRRQASLREVLELTAGAVLELDREIQEPVDLMLNGKIIAKGEVVVIDGNYGLRITEVASGQQRANSL